MWPLDGCWLLPPFSLPLLTYIFHLQELTTAFIPWPCISCEMRRGTGQNWNIVSIKFPWAALTPNKHSHVPCHASSTILPPPTAQTTQEKNFNFGSIAGSVKQHFSPLMPALLFLPCGQMEIAQLSLFFYLNPPCPRLSHPIPHFSYVPGETQTPIPQQRHLWPAGTTSQWQLHGLNMSLSSDFNSCWFHSPIPHGFCISSWAALLFGSPWLYLTRSPNCLHWFYQRLILKAAQ